MSQEPLVSIVTPVYNGEQYLAECIESVLSQTYRNWEYIIVNNCSTDDSLEIARGYASKDARIKICNTPELLPIMKNWNFMMRQISPDSQYCKVVHADDWLYPDCLTWMVALGARHPSVGIIGAYTLRNTPKLACDGLSSEQEVLSGAEICRLALLRRVYPFFSPTCLLIRADLIRRRDPFYDETLLQADVEVLYDLLQECDFGFVHQVLTFVRLHKESATSTMASPMNKIMQQNLHLLVRYGPRFLSTEEYRQQLRKQLSAYYHVLATQLHRREDHDFWEYHRDGLEQAGFRLSRFKLYAAWTFDLAGRVLRKLERAIDYPSS